MKVKISTFDNKHLDLEIPVEECTVGSILSLFCQKYRCGSDYLHITCNGNILRDEDIIV